MVENWRIYHVVMCRHAKPAPKDKFVAIVCLDDGPKGFLINSKVHDFYKQSANRLASQARILAVEHPKTLNWDSWVDCWTLFDFDKLDLADKRNYLSDSAVASIVTAVQQSVTIAVKYKKRILQGRIP